MDEPTISHPSLGTAVFESDYNWWACRVDIRSAYTIDFRVSTWTGTDQQIATADLLDRGSSYVQWVREYENSIRQRVAEEFTGPYNDAWSEAYGPLRIDQVFSRIALNSVELHADGSAYWYYSDGDLFAGHCIEVRLNSDRQVTELLLAG